jgi:hypothetical protein
VVPGSLLRQILQQKQPPVRRVNANVKQAVTSEREIVTETVCMASDTHQPGITWEHDADAL